MPGEEGCGQFLLLYGSETGQAKAIAEKVFDEGGKHGLKAELYCFSETDKKFDIQKEKCIVIIISTTGDGDPPQTVQKFWRRIRKRTLPTDYLSKVSYALLALGDSNYNNFCNCGKTLDKRLEALGAKRFYPTGYGDDAVDLEECVEPWLQGLWESLKIQLNVHHNSFTMNEVDTSSDTIELERRVSDLKIQESERKLDIVDSVSISLTKTSLPSGGQLFSNNKTNTVANSHQEASDVLSVETDKKNASKKLEPSLHQDNFFFTSQDVKPFISNLALGDISLKLPTLPSCNLEVIFHPEINIHPKEEEITYNDEFLPSAASHLTPAAITSAKQLTSSQDVKTSLQLTVNFTDKDIINYEPGDSFGFMCHNPSQEVQELLIRLNVESHADVCCQVKFKDSGKGSKRNNHHLPEYSTLRAILTHYKEIRAIPKKAFLRLLSEYASDEKERRRLNELCSREGSAEYMSWIFTPCLSLLDILTSFPSCKPPIEVILEFLPKLKPRFYSVASSPLAGPECFDILFNIVEIKRNGTKGICTGWLSELCDHFNNSTHTLSPTIKIYKRANTNFYLPKDPSTPIIMVGPGTGIAPFIGFLQHRQNQVVDKVSEFAESWLFYGCRYKDKDFLYKKELYEFQSKGILTKLLVSFSREASDEHLPKYVQDNVISYSSDVGRLIKAGAIIYVCGDAKNMSQDVFKAFASAWKSVEDCSLEIASNYIKELRDEKRYLQDVWT